jgi:hypothetical protein
MYKAKLKQAALVMLNLILWGGIGAMLAYRG